MRGRTPKRRALHPLPPVSFRVYPVPLCIRVHPGLSESSASRSPRPDPGLGPAGPGFAAGSPRPLKGPARAYLDLPSVALASRGGPLLSLKFGQDARLNGVKRRRRRGGVQL